MKRNLTLFGILLGLLLFTYFYEELGQREEIKEQQKREELFSSTAFGTLHKLILPQAEFTFDPSSPVIQVGEHRLRGDAEKIKSLLDLLGSLRVESVLEPAEIEKRGIKTFMGESPLKTIFHFEKGQIEFTLGERLEVSDGFYVHVLTPLETKYAIVTTQKKEQEVYWKQGDAAGREYRHLRNLLSQSNSSFYNLSLLRSKVELASVSVSNLRNRSFTLDFNQMTTDPAPLAGLSVSKQAMESFEVMLNSLEGQKLIAPIDPAKLTDSIATMALTSKSSERAIWEVYRRYDGELGPFLLMKGDHLIYKLGPNALRAFFSNVQEFWDLRPLHGLSASEEAGIATVSVRGESAKMHFPASLKPYFFNQAERVSHRSVDDDIWARHFAELFSLDFQGQRFLVKLYERELMVENEKNGLRYYYRVGEDLPFAPNLKALEGPTKN